MSVSVIIPLYNKAPYIQRALESVVTQTYANFEVVVVDDGSTDGGDEIVARCSDPRVKLIRQKNAGPGAARNRGLREARGEFVAFLDADDEWLPEFLAKAIAYLQRHEEVATISLGHRDDSRGPGAVAATWNARGINDGQYRMGRGGHSAQSAVWLLAYISPCSTVARSFVVMRYGGFFDKWKCLYAEDAYLWLQILLNETVAVSREELVIFHREASDLSGNLAGPHPVEPFLQDPSDLYAACPADRHDLLAEILAIRAVSTAINQAWCGHGREARGLLKRFAQRYRPSMYRRACLYSSFAKVIPLARCCWRFARRSLEIKH
jgi:glycosyltransferase involved in cell wall biosynthesis